MTEIFNPDSWPVDEYLLDEVTVDNDGGLTMSSNGWTFGLRPDEAAGKPVPQVGDTVHLLGGFGFQVRGIIIGDVVYRYVTREQAEQEQEEWRADYARQKEESFYANIPDWIKRKNDLDKPFRDRMNRFANKGFKEFWQESGSYELFTVEQANLLYNHAKAQDNPIAWLDKFYAADWENQKTLFPDLDEGHSGNTFGGMVSLARAVVSGQGI